MVKKGIHSSLLIQKLYKLMFLIGKRIDSELEKKSSLTVSHFMIMTAVKECPSFSQKSVASFLGVTEAAVSRQIELLETKGYLTKKSHPTHKRKLVLHIPPQGEKEWKKTKKIMDRVADTIFGNIEKGEKIRLEHILHTLLEDVEAHYKEGIINECCHD